MIDDDGSLVFLMVAAAALALCRRLAVEPLRRRPRPAPGGKELTQHMADMIAAAVLIAASVVVLVSGVGLIGIGLLSSSGQGASRHAPMFSRSAHRANYVVRGYAMPIVASLMRGLLHGLSMLFGSLGITCLFCSFWVPAIGGYAFVLLATATGVTLALEGDSPSVHRPRH